MDSGHAADSLNGYRRGNLTNCGEVTSVPSRGVEILLPASRHRNRDKLWTLWTSRLQGFTIFFLRGDRNIFVEKEREEEEEDALEEKPYSSLFPNSLQRLIYLYQLKNRCSNVVSFWHWPQMQRSLAFRNSSLCNMWKHMTDLANSDFFWKIVVHKEAADLFMIHS